MGDIKHVNSLIKCKLAYGNAKDFRTLCLGRIRTSDKSAVPGVNRNELHEMFVPAIEDKATQIAIRKNLESIDDKIELNNRINAELEAMAKTLYDYWFVQFDFPFDFAQGKPAANGKPYKSSGGRMVYNPILKREIPEEWNVVKLGESTVTMRIPQSQTATIKSLLEALQHKKSNDAPSENTLPEEEVDEFFTPVISEQPTLLPLFATKVAAGFPSPADDHVEKRLDVSEFLIDHAASTFFVTIRGESMIDVGLLPDDKVVVDRCKTPSHGDIVLAVVDREFTIKILDYGANKMPRLMPANSTGAYRPIYIRPDTQFEIFGVVTGSFRRFK